eukprot:11168833-Ditylum_brightwellii.AAC.1
MAGFGYGIDKLNTFSRSDVETYRMAHAVIGTIASALAILEVLFILLMRKPEDEHEQYASWPLWRRIGHFGHRGCGFLAFLLGAIALETGTHISVTQNENYSAGVIAGFSASALTVALVVQMVTRATSAAEVAHDDEREVEMGDAKKGEHEVGDA